MKRVRVLGNISKNVFSNFINNFSNRVRRPSRLLRVKIQIIYAEFGIGLENISGRIYTLKFW